VAQGLIIKGLCKTFGNTRALHDVDLQVLPHRIHAIVGENGAGKSTLIKIASGVYSSDQGQIELDGTPFRPASPADAQNAGVVVVPQELRTVPRMTAAENVFLGEWPTRRIWGILPTVDRAALNRKMGALMARVGLDLAPDTPMRDLSFAQRQMLVIARALGRDASVLILDEPTASLGSDDCARLFDLLRSLRDKGVAIVFVSHRLEEIESLADTVTVLRDGTVAARYDAGTYTISDLIEAMTGRGLAQQDNTPKRAAGEVIMQAAPAGPGIPPGLHQGQAAGLAGLLGAGGDTLLRRLFGAHGPQDVCVAGQQYQFRQPSDAIKAEIGFVPSERRLGILPQLSVRQNILLPHVSRRHGLKDKDIVRMMALLDIRPSDPDLPAGFLSGGNQQKVLFARWLITNPRVLLLDEPTHGVDVGAKAQILALINDYLEKGGAAMINSAEFSELLQLCDEVHAMTNGAMAAHFDKGDVNYSEQSLRTALGG